MRSLELNLGTSVHETDMLTITLPRIYIYIYKQRDLNSHVITTPGLKSGLSTNFSMLAFLIYLYNFFLSFIFINKFMGGIIYYDFLSVAISINVFSITPITGNNTTNHPK